MAAAAETLHAAPHLTHAEEPGGEKRSIPERLNGSFAIVIHDARQLEAHLITDPVTTRPLHYDAGGPVLVRL
ncbi:MAG: hypothetical protein ACE5JM_17735 [Armatimonadota bacterium]